MDYNEYQKQINFFKRKWLESCPYLTDDSGIYVLIRRENGFSFAYVGQSIHVLTRLAQHYNSHNQHIDNSLHTHRLYSKDNPEGWFAMQYRVPPNELDKYERYYMLWYAHNGYQLLNKTSGGQDNGKFGISSNKEGKGYRDGIKQGYKNAMRDIARYFKHSLAVCINGSPNKIKERHLNEFIEKITGELEENG